MNLKGLSCAAAAAAAVAPGGPAPAAAAAAAAPAAAAAAAAVAAVAVADAFGSGSLLINSCSALVTASRRGCLPPLLRHRAMPIRWCFGGAIGCS